jgi:hypothetical protein
MSGWAGGPPLIFCESSDRRAKEKVRPIARPFPPNTMDAQRAQRDVTRVFRNMRELHIKCDHVRLACNLEILLVRRHMQACSKSPALTPVAAAAAAAALTLQDMAVRSLDTIKTILQEIEGLDFLLFLLQHQQTLDQVCDAAISRCFSLTHTLTNSASHATTEVH